jgi:hypothetical protein
LLIVGVSDAIEALWCFSPSALQAGVTGSIPITSTNFSSITKDLLNLSNLPSFVHTTVHELRANLELDASQFIRNLLYLWQHLTKANGAADMVRAVLVAAPNAWVRQ